MRVPLKGVAQAGDGVGAVGREAVAVEPILETLSLLLADVYDLVGGCACCDSDQLVWEPFDVTREAVRAPVKRGPVLSLDYDQARR